MTPTLCEYDTHFVIWGIGLYGSSEFKKSDGWTRPLLQSCMDTMQQGPPPESLEKARQESYSEGYSEGRNAGIEEAIEALQDL